MTITRSTSLPVILLIIGMVIFSVVQIIAPLISLIPYSINVETSHAYSKHGIDASAARECSRRPELRFYNDNTRRTAYMCVVSGMFGIHIIDDRGEEVTAFLKNKMRTVDQVVQYMKNSGYTLLH